MKKQLVRQLDPRNIVTLVGFVLWGVGLYFAHLEAVQWAAFPSLLSQTEAIWFAVGTAFLFFGNGVSVLPWGRETDIPGSARLLVCLLGLATFVVGFWLMFVCYDVSRRLDDTLVFLLNRGPLFSAAVLLDFTFGIVAMQAAWNKPPVQPVQKS